MKSSSTILPIFILTFNIILCSNAFALEGSTESYSYSEDDLTITSLILGQLSDYDGDEWRLPVEVIVENQGTEAHSYDHALVHVCLSADRTCDNGEDIRSHRHVYRLYTGAAYTIHFNIGIPASEVSSNPYVIAIVDRRNDIEEFNEANNLRADPLIPNGDCRTDDHCRHDELCSNFNINTPHLMYDRVPHAMCVPAWMLGTFSSEDSITINADDADSLIVPVSELATVGMNAFLSFELELNDDSADLNDFAVHVNPCDTGYDTNFSLDEVTDIYDMTIDSSNVLTLTDLPIFTASDDGVNCDWIVTITNSSDASVQLSNVSLKLSSRWD